MTAAVIEKQHVTRTPGVCGGKPCVAGTRVRVWDVYQWFEEGGASVAEIVEQFPQLTPADVHAAMAYFWDHEAEIRREMADADAALAAARAAAGPSKLDAHRHKLQNPADARTVSP